MNEYLLLICLLILGFATIGTCQVNNHHVWVNGYYKSDGTYIPGYFRTAPNSTNLDNFSTIGNTNPYTYQPGWIPRDRSNIITNVYPQGVEFRPLTLDLSGESRARVTVPSLEIPTFYVPPQRYIGYSRPNQNINSSRQVQNRGSTRTQTTETLRSTTRKVVREEFTVSAYELTNSARVKNIKKISCSCYTADGLSVSFITVPKGTEITIIDNTFTGTYEVEFEKRGTKYTGFIDGTSLVPSQPDEGVLENGNSIQLKNRIRRQLSCNCYDNFGNSMVVELLQGERVEIIRRLEFEITEIRFFRGDLLYQGYIDSKSVR